MFGFNLLVVALALFSPTKLVIARPTNTTLTASTVLGDGITSKSGRINANLQWQSASGEIGAVTRRVVGLNMPYRTIGFWSLPWQHRASNFHHRLLPDLTFG